MPLERNKGRHRASILASAAILASLAALAPLALDSASGASSNKAAKPESRTIGLTLTSWTNGLYETPKLTECDHGVQPSENDQQRAMKEAPGRMQTVGGSYETRGPNFETGNFVPLAMEDPLPFHELLAKEGYGLNLDGTPDGHATAKTCKHDKFVSVGEDNYGASKGQMIDNQLSRVIGCVEGYRTDGMMSKYYTEEITNFAVNRLLINITGVDSEVNDPHVDVTIYKGFDRVVRMPGDNKFVVGLSQRIDPRYPQYTMHTTGKIVNGVLTTDPIADARMPTSQERSIGDRLMKDMRLVLKLTPEGADGILAGYDDWQKWYNIHSKHVVAEVGKYSSPNIYRALRRYADGYPDANGQCTHISATYKVAAVRSVIVPAIDPKSRLAAQK